MNSSSGIALCYAIFIAFALLVNQQALAICLAIMMHAFYTRFANKEDK